MESELQIEQLRTILRRYTKEELVEHLAMQPGASAPLLPLSLNVTKASMARNQATAHCKALLDRMAGANGAAQLRLLDLLEKAEAKEAKAERALDRAHQQIDAYWREVNARYAADHIAAMEEGKRLARETP